MKLISFAFSPFGAGEEGREEGRRVQHGNAKKLWAMRIASGKIVGRSGDEIKFVNSSRD